MCNAFSFIVRRDKHVFWKLGLDSHEKLREVYTLKDIPNLSPCEIAPKNKDYLNPDEWVFKFDDKTPDWWKAGHEKASWDAFNAWKRKLDKVLIYKPIVHPFKLKPPKITGKHIALLKEWAKVRDSVWDSVGGSVWGSVRDSVWDSVGGSVRDSVGGSVYACSGSFFRFTKWKGVKHKKGVYPFVSAVKLWEQGIVPSFDGKVWRLHGGKDAKVLFQITDDALKAWKPKKRKEMG